MRDEIRIGVFHGFRVLPCAFEKQGAVETKQSFLNSLEGGRFGYFARIDGINLFSTTDNTGRGRRTMVYWRRRQQIAASCCNCRIFRPFCATAFPDSLLPLEDLKDSLSIHRIDVDQLNVLQLAAHRVKLLQSDATSCMQGIPHRKTLAEQDAGSTIGAPEIIHDSQQADKEIAGLGTDGIPQLAIRYSGPQKPLRHRLTFCAFMACGVSPRLAAVSLFSELFNFFP